MPSLKDLKVRIKSVKNTQKITKAMKMVAAAKLRRAREAAEASRPYAEAMERLVASLAASQRNEEMKNGGNEERKNSSILQFSNSSHPLLVGTGRDQTHLIIVATADRGLCGAFNSSIVRAARRKLRELLAQGKTVKLLFIGRKGFEQLQGEFGKYAVARVELPKRKLAYGDAESIAKQVIERFGAGEFDVCHVVYNTFKSAISQEVTWQQLVPLAQASGSGLQDLGNEITEARSSKPEAPYDYEPSEEEILGALLPKNLSMQIFKAMLENAASEQGARMTAMDNATRNAGDMIRKLNLKYNRTRQAAITKELIEIISGAEAV